MVKGKVQISKESVWWVVKHLIAIVILYIIYIYFMPFGKHTIVITRLNLLNFIMQLIITSLLIYAAYAILVDLIINILIGKLLLKYYGNPLRDIPLFRINIPMIQDDIDEFDKKFKRKTFKTTDAVGNVSIPDRETNYNFCQRIINDAIKEKLKRGKNEKRK